MLWVRHEEDDCGLSRGRVRRSAEVTCWSNKSRSNTPKLEKRKDSDQSAEGLGHEDPTANQLLLVIKRRETEGYYTSGAFFFCVINLEVFFYFLFFSVWIAFCWIRVYRLKNTLFARKQHNLWFCFKFFNTVFVLSGNRSYKTSLGYLLLAHMTAIYLALGSGGVWHCVGSIGSRSFVLLFLRWGKSSSCSPTGVWNYPQN